MDLALVCSPTITFWTFSTFLHLCGANDHYNGKVPVRSLLLVQLRIDVLLFLSNVPRVMIPNTSDLDDWQSSEVWGVRWYMIFLGMCGVDWVEYWCHRSMHEVSFLKHFHRLHHKLIPVHTFGSYYNSMYEVAYVGAGLGLMLVAILKLSVAEVSLVSCIGTVFTVWDHTPTDFPFRDVFDIEKHFNFLFMISNNVHSTLSDHEIHHNVCSRSNYSQPFWIGLDWAFGTRYEDVLRKEGRFDKLKGCDAPVKEAVEQKVQKNVEFDPTDKSNNKLSFSAINVDDNGNVMRKRLWSNGDEIPIGDTGVKIRT